MTNPEQTGSSYEEQLERIPAIAASAGEGPREFQIFGPPGTGKTTNVTRQVKRAVQAFGAGSVLVTSFSRAAAAELAGRDLPLPANRVGTLHSHCLHALGTPAIAEVNVDGWNRDHPHLRITPARKLSRLDSEPAGDEPAETARNGDRLLQQLNRVRGMLLPPEAWPAELRKFSASWSAWKESHDLLDFCDLIETALHDLRIAPGNPSVLFTDEAQDLNPMQLALIRKWSSHTQYSIGAMDDDQTLYSWLGAEPEAILDPEIPEDHKIILSQSFRVPRAVHSVADKLIHQVTRRQEKFYLPRPADGAFVRLSTGGWKSPEYGILKAATGHLARGQSVMFLASCAYMLRATAAVLRRQGIPFHNPYRKSDGCWNPLRLGHKGSSVNRILALLAAHPGSGGGHRQWTHRDLGMWTECLYSKGLLKSGAKAKIDAADQSAPVTLARLDELLERPAMQSLLLAFDGDNCQLLGWWGQRLTATFHSRVRFPLEIALAAGPDALHETPKVILGTIHSVKGGEADVVFLFPDLSPVGDAAYQRFGRSRDSVLRQFYVGMTRARDTVYLCQPESGMAVRI